MSKIRNSFILSLWGAGNVGKVLQTVRTSPGLNITSISEAVELTIGETSKIISDLRDIEFLELEVEGTSKYVYPMENEFYEGLKDVLKIFVNEEEF